MTRTPPIASVDTPKFREWYEARYEKYPGRTGEHYSQAFERLAGALADYVDEVVEKLKKESA